MEIMYNICSKKINEAVKRHETDGSLEGRFLCKCATVTIQARIYSFKDRHLTRQDSKAEHKTEKFNKISELNIY